MLRIDADFDFGPFNPHAVDCSGSTYVFPFIYSFLCVPDPEGELKPDLAASWTYDPDTLTWHIRLRNDARFHAGTPVTADDVLFSLRSLFEKRNQSMGDAISSIAATGPHAIEIRMKTDAPRLLRSIWDMHITPGLSRHTRLDLNTSPVGSGPFIFADKTADGRVILTANEAYYKGRPAIDKVILYYIPDRETSWARLIKGETDVVGNLAVKSYEMIKQYADRFYFSKYDHHYYSILLYNTHHRLFESPLVRRALTHGINRDEIAAEILGGMAEVIAGPLESNCDWHHPELKPLTYDPPLALEYLKKAGWTLDPDAQCLMKNGRKFEFELLLPAGSQTDLRVARLIKLNLNEVGIWVHLGALPPDELIKRYYQNTEFDAALVEIGTPIRRTEETLKLWAAPYGAATVAGAFHSSEADRLANQILNAKDPENKQMLLRRFDQIVADLQPGSFLFRKISIDAMSKRFALKYPFSFDHQGFYRLQHARPKNAG